MKSIGHIKQSGEKATVTVEYSHPILVNVGKDAPVQGYEPWYFNVELKQTDKGWRVSGGSFIDFLTYKISSPIDNPSTGSPTPIYLTLAGAAILCALPVVKRKRRFCREA